MSHIFTKLTLITIATFMFSIGLNAALGGNPFNRIGYAVFVSLVPGLASFILFKVSKSRVTDERKHTKAA